MKTIYPILTGICIVLVLLLSSCTNTITSKKDYQKFLAIERTARLQSIQAKLAFWENKLNAAPNQVSYYSKAASSHSQLFEATAILAHLKAADSLLVQANKMVNHKNSSLLRALARNYISQHRFREALALLQKAEKLGDNKKATQKMLFDVYLELGNDKMASFYLDTIKSENDFDYQIRLSKWNDHNGDLTEAIHILEQTLPFVSTSSDELKLWTYSNLADYYGHAGLIGKSYEHYLKAITIDPGYTYALRGISWIVFSHEKNVEEARLILDAIAQKYPAPDLHLIKADMASFENKDGVAADHIAAYFKKLAQEDYGVMYDKYNALLLAESQTNTEKAIAIAQKEIKNRPTAQSYDLLAWAYYHHGDYENATAIVDKYVYGKTSEPEVLFHIATIYKAEGRTKEVNVIKKELLASTYELGPHKISAIQSL